MTLTITIINNNIKATVCHLSLNYQLFQHFPYIYLFHFIIAEVVNFYAPLSGDLLHVSISSFQRKITLPLC